MRTSVANLIYWPWPQIYSRKFHFTSCLHTAEYHYLFEGHKIFEYQTKTDLLNGCGTCDKGWKDWGSNTVL